MLKVTEPGIIFSTLLSNEVMVIDDKNGEKRKIQAMGTIIRNDSQFLVELPKHPVSLDRNGGPFFKQVNTGSIVVFIASLRPLYYEDGRVHVGNEELALLNESANSIQEAVELHNRLNDQWKIHCVVTFP